MKLEASRVVWITFVGDRTEPFPACPDDKGLVVALVDWEIAEGIRAAPGCYGPSGGGQITRGYFEAEAAKVLAWWAAHGVTPEHGIYDAWADPAGANEEDEDMDEPVTPITPDAARAGGHIPPAVLRAFNELIAEAFDGRTAVVRQADVIARILLLDPTIERDALFARGWLNVEGRFEAAGWTVEYDKPGFDERYEPFFRFTQKRGR